MSKIFLRSCLTIILLSTVLLLGYYKLISNHVSKDESVGHIPIIHSTAPFNKDLFLRGDLVKTWEADPVNRLKYITNNTYQFIFKIDSPGIYKFKIADWNWSKGLIFGGCNYGQEIVLGQKAEIIEGAVFDNCSIHIPNKGNYVMKFSVEDSYRVSILRLEEN